MAPFSPDILSRELLVAREIRVAETEEGAGPVYFNMLVERLKGKGASRATISKALDILFDQGVVTAEWTTTPEGTHVRGLKIAGEAQSFVDEVVRQTEA